MITIGSVMLPIILTKADDGTRVGLVLYTLVVPKLLMGMFIGGFSDFMMSIGYQRSVPGISMTIDLGNE